MQHKIKVKEEFLDQVHLTLILLLILHTRRISNLNLNIPKNKKEGAKKFSKDRRMIEINIKS